MNSRLKRSSSHHLHCARTCVCRDAITPFDPPGRVEDVFGLTTCWQRQPIRVGKVRTCSGIVYAVRTVQVQVQVSVQMCSSSCRSRNLL